MNKNEQIGGGNENNQEDWKKKKISVLEFTKRTTIDAEDGKKVKIWEALFGGDNNKNLSAGNRIAKKINDLQNLVTGGTIEEAQKANEELGEMIEGLQQIHKVVDYALNEDPEGLIKK